MSASRKSRGKWQRRLVDPPRAVIDIGSNTVRLVIYEGTSRAPETVWNEKVSARLGRDLSATGRIPDEAAEEALAALARYKTLIDDHGIEDVQTVATAAARDAENGAQFLAEVASLGLEPRLLSGTEEACASAYGAIGAFPGAAGVVADLGGGSLELISIVASECKEAISLPFGTLRLSTLRQNAGKFASMVEDRVGQANLSTSPNAPLYMVGGTWRALAYFAMARADYALTDPHGFTLSVDNAQHLCAELLVCEPEELHTIAGISTMRAGYLPDAAALLSSLLKTLRPSRLVFSSWGIREGLLFMRLSEQQRGLDPMLAAVNAFAHIRNAELVDATRVAGWTAALANRSDGRTERLRVAAAQLGAALQRVEPNMRADHAEDWALDKRWIDCSASDRALLCAALYGSLGRTKVPARVLELAPETALREATTWGLGHRLARRLGAGSRTALTHSRLSVNKERVTLTIDESRVPLVTDTITRELDMLAVWISRKPKVVVTSDLAAETAA